MTLVVPDTRKNTVRICSSLDDGVARFEAAGFEQFYDGFELLRLRAGQGIKRLGWRRANPPSRSGRKGVEQLILTPLQSDVIVGASREIRRELFSSLICMNRRSRGTDWMLVERAVSRVV